MPRASPSQLTLCRLVYTDASILTALISKDASNAVACLDRAIIIAGGAGRDRRHIIQELIASLQTRLAHSVPPTIQSPSPSPLPDQPLSSSTSAIPRIPAPSFLAFQATHSKRPFIIPGYALDWPALSDHPWHSQAYMRSVTGPARMVPVEVGKHYLLDNWTQSILSWDTFLSSLDSDDENVFYLAQHNLFLQFPALENDIIVPDYAYASLPEGKHYRGPPNTEEQLIIHNWLGPKGTVSPAHVDPYNNLYGTCSKSLIGTRLTAFQCR